MLVVWFIVHKEFIDEMNIVSQLWWNTDIVQISVYTVIIVFGYEPAEAGFTKLYYLSSQYSCVEHCIKYIEIEAQCFNIINY